MKRRQFLQTAALTGGVALAPRWAFPAGSAGLGCDRLIAIFLRGAARPWPSPRPLPCRWTASSACIRPLRASRPCSTRATWR